MLYALVKYDPARFDESWHLLSHTQIARAHLHHQATLEGVGWMIAGRKR